MIRVRESDIRARARQMPVGYLAECERLAAVRGSREWHFHTADYLRIKQKYRRFVRSESDRLQDGPISGCCDRADQY